MPPRAGIENWAALVGLALLAAVGQSAARAQESAQSPGFVGLPAAPAWRDDTRFLDGPERKSGRVVRSPGGSIDLDPDPEPRSFRVCPLRAPSADCRIVGLASAMATAEWGDTLILTPGEYREAAVLRNSGVTIRAEAGAHLIGVAAEGKAALVVKGDDTVIEGLECSEISVPDRNGACIRLEGRNLTLRRVYFHDSEEGILGGGGRLLIEDSRFERLGKNGRAHGLYVWGDEVILRRTWVLSSKSQGHEVKSRAKRTVIEESVIASLDGQDSRLVDISNGGEVIIRNNVLEQGPKSVNHEMIGLGYEGLRFEDNDALIENNVILVDRPRTKIVAGPQLVIVRDNVVVGGRRLAGNRWFRDRSEAGLAPYPFLPDPRDGMPLLSE